MKGCGSVAIACSVALFPFPTGQATAPCARRRRLGSLGDCPGDPDAFTAAEVVRDDDTRTTPTPDAPTRLAANPRMTPHRPRGAEERGKIAAWSACSESAGTSFGAATRRGGAGGVGVGWGLEAVG